MNNKRRIEIFSAGCPVCDETVALVKQTACPSCKVEFWICAKRKRRRKPNSMAFKAFRQ